MNRINIDVNENRELIKQFSGLEDIDSMYTFYYDETNNIRKFYLKEDGFNASEDANFVLGGVMHDGQESNVDFSVLLKELKLQNNIEEIKLKHLASGNFIKCLKSKKIHIFLDWLIKSDLYIHYSNEHFA